MDTIHAETLIRLVEERPAIWDKSLDVYKDKNLKESSWREICGILNEQFEFMEQRERQDFGKLVLKKWTQVRDSWIKSIKKHIDQKKSTFPVKPSRPYIYHKQMSFLKKIVDEAINAYDDITYSVEDDNRNEDSSEDNIFIKNEEIEGVYEQSTVKLDKSGTQRKRKLEINSELDTKMVKYIDNEINISNSDNENRHLLFFKSLLPSLLSFSDDQTLEFQAGVISLLQNIKQLYQNTI